MPNCRRKTDYDSVNCRSVLNVCDTKNNEFTEYLSLNAVLQFIEKYGKDITDAEVENKHECLKNECLEKPKKEIEKVVPESCKKWLDAAAKSIEAIFLPFLI